MDGGRASLYASSVDGSRGVGVYSEGWLGSWAAGWAVASAWHACRFIVLGPRALVAPHSLGSCAVQWLQTRLWERHRVRTLRRTLAQLAAEGQLDPQGRLSVGGRPVAVVYFRAGYTPDDYPRWALQRAGHACVRGRSGAGGSAA